MPNVIQITAISAQPFIRTSSTANVSIVYITEIHKHTHTPLSPIIAIHIPALMACEENKRDTQQHIMIRRWDGDHILIDRIWNGRENEVPLASQHAFSSLITIVQKVGEQIGRCEKTVHVLVHRALWPQKTSPWKRRISAQFQSPSLSQEQESTFSSCCLEN